VTAPTLVLLPATGFEERRYVDEQEHSYLGMRLSPDAAAALAVDPWRMVPLPPGTPATGLVRLAVSRARAGAGAAADAHLRSLVAMVLDGCTEQQPGPRWSPTVDRALDAIRHAWARAGLRDLPLSELATSAGVTTTSLCRAFARDIGTSPMAYQRLLRARIAVHRLRHSHQTVKRIAIETGFGDSRHLGRSLHHLFGHGSMEFRRNTRIVLPMPPGLDLVLWNEAMQE
jgi:AraC-like DNA-binding protein